VDHYFDNRPQWSCFFILPGLTWTNLGIYLAVLFYQPCKKFGLFFTRLVKRTARYMPRLARVKLASIKNKTIVAQQMLSNKTRTCVTCFRLQCTAKLLDWVHLLT